VLESLVLTVCLYGHGGCTNVGNAYMAQNPIVGQRIEMYGRIAQRDAITVLGTDLTETLGFGAYAFAKREVHVGLGHGYALTLSAHETKTIGLAFNF
jgi:hypothetical protein